MQPFEKIAVPFDIYLAPVGTAFPNVGTPPIAPWVKLGSSGSKDYDESGIKIMHNQKVTEFRTLGRTGPIKAFRDQEDFKIHLTMYDLTLEQYRRALNDASVQAVVAASGVPGSKTLPLHQGLGVSEYALLAAAKASPEGAVWYMQYELARCYAAGNRDLIFNKSKPAGLLLEFCALEDPNAAAGAEFGYVRVQSADALP